MSTHSLRKKWQRRCAKNIERMRLADTTAQSMLSGRVEMEGNSPFGRTSIPRRALIWGKRSRSGGGKSCTDCHQLRQDVDHFNSIHRDEEPVQLILNFEDACGKY
jgi:hypothetical protein